MNHDRRGLGRRVELLVAFSYFHKEYVVQITLKSVLLFKWDLNPCYCR